MLNTATTQPQETYIGVYNVNRRVVVTGVGLVTPLGTGTEKTWKNIVDGVSGIDTITRFDVSNSLVTIAAEVKDFEPDAFFSYNFV